MKKLTLTIISFLILSLLVLALTFAIFKSVEKKDKFCKENGYSYSELHSCVKIVNNNMIRKGVGYCRSKSGWCLLENEE